MQVIKNYENLNNSELKVLFEETKNKWTLSSKKGVKMIAELCEILEIDPENLTISEVEKKFNIVLYKIVSLHLLFVKNDILEEEYEDMDYTFEFNKIFQIIYYSRELIYNICNTEVSLDPQRENELNTEIGVSRFIPINYDNITPYQHLILFLLKKLFDKGYMRYGEFCYSRVYNNNNQFTYSWEQKLDIEQFVYNETQKESQFEQWKNLTKDKGNLKAVCNYLQTCVDPQFRDLKKNRNIFSFQNGVYITKRSELYEDYFYTYGDIPQLPPDTISCKFFDSHFDNFEDITDWYDIPTPAIQSILDYQFKDNGEYKSICRWVYILIGRLLYNAGEFDDWQIMPFIRGIAGSGKSSILTQVIQKFYDPNDIGILSNDLEKTFGLSGIFDKYLFIGPEIKKNFALSQALLQSMISAEDVSIPIKHKTAESIKWKIPGIMAGNEIPSYQDSSGSISRRFVIIDFRKLVKAVDSDPLLRNKLTSEVPKIIKKCNKAYLESIKNFGNKNIWPHLPKFFQQTKEKLKEQTNSMQHFLMSGKIKFSNDLYCAEKDFKFAFYDHCKDNNFPKMSYSPDLYELPFYEMAEKYSVQIVVERKRKKWPKDSKSIKHINFISGLDLVEDEEDE